MTLVIVALPEFYDPVTVVHEGQLRHVMWEFERTHSAEATLIQKTRGRPGSRLRLDNAGIVRIADEGITWCRGHIGEETDDGRALLAAATMTEKPHSVRASDFPQHRHRHRTM